jgi:hypothetical protein
MSNSEEKGVNHHREMSITDKKKLIASVVSGSYDMILGELSNPHGTQTEFSNSLAGILNRVSYALLNGTLPWLPSFLSGFLRDNSDATGVLAEFLGPSGLQLLSMTSRGNQSALKDPLCKMVCELMVKGRVVSYLTHEGEMVMAIIACVFVDNAGNRVYHMAFVNDDNYNLTETLFGYEVPWRISANSTKPDYPIELIPDTIYGNPGSIAAEYPHAMCPNGWYDISCGLPFDLRSTAPEICRMYTKSDLKSLGPSDCGSFPKFGTSKAGIAHQTAIDLLKKQRPGVPTHFPGGYPEEATNAMQTYQWNRDNLHHKHNISLYTEALQTTNTALNDLYRAMPDIPRRNVENYNSRCRCQHGKYYFDSGD